jgi:hypothetical protein
VARVEPRPINRRRPLVDCRPTGWRHALRVLVALGVVVPAITALLLLVFGERGRQGPSPIEVDDVAGWYAGAVFMMAVAAAAIVSTRLSWLASIATGLSTLTIVAVILYTSPRRAPMVTTPWIPIEYIGAILLMGLGAVALMIVDPVLHALERRRLARDIDPVVATARLVIR